MRPWMGRLASSSSSCWGRLTRRYYAAMKRKADDCDAAPNVDPEDRLVWSRGLGKHSAGEYSFAVAQANDVIEDHSQVETGPAGTFVGVYDGHGGADAARFVADHLFRHLVGIAREAGTISEEVVRNAFTATEDGFLAHVRRMHPFKPVIAAIGSCCLVGVIWRGTLHIANLGDSRAVVGSLNQSTNKIVAEQITRDHNACLSEVRQELRSLHPDDSNIVVLKHGVWRIKGIIQVSRTIGDAYLKRPEYSMDPTVARFKLSEPLRRPILSSEPSIVTRVLRPEDQFLIFASDGLWEQLTNQEAVDIVCNNPRPGIAKRLVKAALKEAARKRQMRYEDLKKVEKGIRRYFHDDITVVVIFIDHDSLKDTDMSLPELSVRGFVDSIGPSHFSTLDGLI